MKESDRQLGKPGRLYRNTKTAIEALSLDAGDEGCEAYATNTNQLGTFDGATWHWSDLDTTVPDHDHTGDVGDGGQISHDTALSDVSADDHHAQDHKDRHDPVDGADPFDTETPVATGTANAQGTSHNFVRGDHVHALHDHDHTGDTGDGGILTQPVISLAFSWMGF